MKACAFCERSGVKMSREHVLPRWLSRAGGHAGGYTWEHNGKTMHSAIMDVVTKQICRDCNTGWLSRIEDGAERVINPLLTAAATKISELDRWVISRWWTKTLMTCQLALVSRGEATIIDTESYARFFTSPQPSLNQMTFLSGYQGTLLPIFFALRSPKSATQEPGAFFFHFHNVVLWGFISPLDVPVDIRLPTGINDAAHIVWPPQRGLLWCVDPTEYLPWPPSYVLDEPAVINLRQMLGVS